jgi:hypothetical protein
MRIHHHLPAILLAISTATIAVPASADMIAPAVLFGVVDDNFDGTADEFSSASLSDAITTRFRERRAFAEFDLSTLGGPVIQSATITGTLNEQFSFGFGTSPADFEFDLYNGNGVADLGDFGIAGTNIGMLTVAEDFDSVGLVFDVTAALQGLVDAGATHAGFRGLTIDSNVGQADVNDLMLEVVAIPEPAAFAGLLLGTLLFARRR